MSHIIIDGYNFIRTAPSLAGKNFFTLESERLSLLRLLASYREITGHKVTVVFDAHHTDNWNLGIENRAGINIIFSRSGETADEVIIEMAREKKNQLIIVSSDNQILSEARRNKCGILKSDEFDQRLLQTRLMSQSPFGKSEEKEKKPVHKRWATKKKGPAKRLPKEKRRALARLKHI